MAVVDARDRVGRAGKVGRPLRGRRLGHGGGGLAAKKRKKRKIGDGEVGDRMVSQRPRSADTEAEGRTLAPLRPLKTKR